MKNSKQLAIISLGSAALLFGVSGASAQSLGDYARAARKSKPETTSAAHHYDNDNLPVNDTLSVVGPPPPAEAANGQSNDGSVSSQASRPSDPATATADRQKTADEWKKKVDQQKEKVDALNHELDLQQREYRLRAASYYSDAGARLRDAAQWDKDDTQYKSDVDGKQKAIQTAQQQLDDLLEQARKAGAEQKDSGKDNTTDKK